ncbi:MAG: ATP-dependent DNA helicase RecG [bacterium]
MTRNPKPLDKLASVRGFKGGLETPIQFCPGVGPQRGAIFERLGIYTIQDLFWHLPRGYEDYHSRTPVLRLRAGELATVSVEVTAVEERLPRHAGKVRHILEARVSDRTADMIVVWFNQPFLRDKVKRGVRLLLHGKVELYNSFLQMSSPKYQILDREEPETGESGILPLYPLSEGLTQGVVRKVIQKALERFGAYCEEFLPPEWLERHGYPGRRRAFSILHCPKPGDGAPTDVNVRQMNFLWESGEEEALPVPCLTGAPDSIWEKARRRLVFEEFWLHQLLTQKNRAARQQQRGIAHPSPDPSPWGEDAAAANPSNPRSWPAVFVNHLPFRLTEDQIRVCREFEQDMNSSRPMNRLLQGDVGSGKTVVSLYAMVVAAAGGAQAALMAPTELLAQQHANTVRKLTAGLPELKTVLLIGSDTPSERQAHLQALADGSARIAVGTHALFQEQVEFANLGLVVVDEQHKFGVQQRQRLIEKGTHPDLLVATATPIPRTLSLTMFGDMDVSVIRSLPPGRPAVITRWTTWDKETKVWEFVEEKIAAGQQAYVVCPIIEPSENVPHLPSTEEAFEKLSRTFLPHRRVELLHGRHSAETKAGIMARMQAGEVDVVVATTVIEVGVDLPNATIMVVLGADRFGLAQLHQLRGRVGRGTRKSYCILITPDTISPFALKRMQAMEKTRDGFVIAEEDLRLRGPGESFGIRQSGHLKFRLADPFHDLDLLQEAHEEAKKLYQEDPSLSLASNQRIQKELDKAGHHFEGLRPS